MAAAAGSSAAAEAARREEAARVRLAQKWQKAAGANRGAAATAVTVMHDWMAERREISASAAVDEACKHFQRLAHYAAPSADGANDRAAVRCSPPGRDAAALETAERDRWDAEHKRLRTEVTEATRRVDDAVGMLRATLAAYFPSIVPPAPLPRGADAAARAAFHAADGPARARAYAFDRLLALDTAARADNADRAAMVGAMSGVAAPAQHTHVHLLGAGINDFAAALTPTGAEERIIQAGIAAAEATTALGTHVATGRPSETQADPVAGTTDPRGTELAMAKLLRGFAKFEKGSDAVTDHPPFNIQRADERRRLEAAMRTGARSWRTVQSLMCMHDAAETADEDTTTDRQWADSLREQRVTDADWPARWARFLLCLSPSEFQTLVQKTGARAASPWPARASCEEALDAVLKARSAGRTKNEKNKKPSTKSLPPGTELTAFQTAAAVLPAAPAAAGRGPPAGQPRCFNCGSNDHWKPGCPHLARGPRCFRCSAFGHIAADCTGGGSKDAAKGAAAGAQPSNGDSGDSSPNPKRD